MKRNKMDKNRKGEWK